MFCLGNIIGSFLNVVIYRFNSGKTLGGRSMCMTCSTTLRWYELVPVLSFLFQKGRCNSCSSRISHQYPLVEFSTGIVFAILTYHFAYLLPYSTTNFVFLLSYFSLIFSLLIVIAVYDIKHKVIPDKLVYFFAIVSFCGMFINSYGVGQLFYVPSLWQISVGPMLAIPFALIWLLSKGRLMGLGDGKLILGIGWLLGFSLGLSALVMSFWVGAVVSLLILFFSKMKVGMKTEIPFAPFLILGTFLAFVCHITIYKLAGLFMF